MLEFEGTTLGNYQLQHRLARGGMSEVYLAYDERTRGTVAIKVVHRSDAVCMKRFQCEVKALSMLTHKYILPTLDYGEHGSWCYFVMPYIEGGTLSQRLATGPFSQEDAGMILEQIASALQYAHEHGILHRDIKPANILLHTDKHVYLADFGLAKELEEASDLSQTEELIGTPEYLAPELTQGPGSASSDINALGIVLYQMLTGKVPFKASTPIGVCWKHVREQPVPPSLINSAISHSVEQVILCALEKDPGRRFQNVQAMAYAYNQALQAPPYLQTLQLAAPHIHYKAVVKTTRSPGQQALILHRAYHWKVHPAFVALAAIVFFMFPLSLGLLVYKDSLSEHLPVALGDNIAFTQMHGTLHEVPPHLPPAPITQAPTRAGHSSQSSNGQTSSHSNRSMKVHSSRSMKVHSNGHRYGHKHRHRHKHSHQARNDIMGHETNARLIGRTKIR